METGALSRGAAVMAGALKEGRPGRYRRRKRRWGAAAVVELELPNGVRVRVPAEREAAVAAAIRAAGELAEPRAAAGEESAAC